MATVTKKRALALPDPGFGGVPYGNMAVLRYNMTTNSSGVFADSNQTTAVAIGDVVRLGVLPAGMVLLDMLAVVSNAFTASSTAKIGFAYVDGTDVTATPQDDDYFCAATSIASAAIIRKTATTAPVKLPKDAYLILTTAGAALDEVGVIDIAIIGQLLGNP